jgi:hypothetical protein
MTRAQALLAVARLATTEADAVFYAYPPASEEELAEANRLAELADRAFEDADQAGAKEDDWQTVMQWLGVR